MAAERPKKRKFSEPERWAVYTVHGEKCYICGKPLTLHTMEVDHVIPEALTSEAAKLQEILKQFGLPPDFDLQSYANWMPACARCNLEKLEVVFEATPLIQLRLQRAAKKASDAAAKAASFTSDRSAAKAWSTIKRAYEGGQLVDELRADIEEFFAFHERQRLPELEGQPLRLMPLVEVLAERDGIRIVRGPYGIGGGPISPISFENVACGNCGGTEWNGARCVRCGTLNDD